MAIEKFDIAGLHIAVARNTDSDKLAYVLYPMDGPDAWIAEASAKFGVTIAVITGMDWDDDLTPWPAKGVPAGSADFKGLAARFLTTMTDDVVPAVEQRLGVDAAERTLVGVSLSGLFTLWQWSGCDVFHNIASLSGSFWYSGFIEWFERQDYSPHKGKAFFLLGDKESKSNIKAFQPVQANTEKIVATLKEQGVDTAFSLVPGNHYQHGIERLSLSFAAIYGERRKY